MTIADYKNLSIEDAVLFDFTKDTISGEDIQSEYNSSDFWKRYCMYITSSKIKDPDTSSGLLNTIYKELWKINQEYYMYGKNRIASDTMTSFNHSLATLMKIQNNCEINGKKLEKLKKDFKNKRYSSELFCKWYECQEIPENDLKKMVKPLLPLLRVYHTIGNYCPVPVHFNNPRSGGGGYDYWDLTMEKIYEYYHRNNDTDSWKIIGEDLLHGRGNVLACVLWLNSYGKEHNGWVNFVDKNYLQDYVEKEYIPKPFIEGHTWEKINIEKAEMLCGIAQEAANRIIRRGVRIVLAMKNIEHNGIEGYLDEIYQKLNT